MDADEGNEELWDDLKRTDYDRRAGRKRGGGVFRTKQVDAVLAPPFLTENHTHKGSNTR